MVRQNKPVSKSSSKSLPIPNIVPGARLRVIDDSDPNRPVWRTLESSIIYSPRAINQALHKHGLQSAWVFWTCGQELWFSGDQLASRR